MMIPLIELWLPILLSAVFVFLVSSIIHCVLPIHTSDCKKLPGEEKILEEMRRHTIEPGGYMFPHAGSMKDMGSPEMLEKYKLGPVGFLTITPSGSPSMGKGLALWFLYALLMSVFAGYLAGLALDRDAGFRAVFRVTATVAVLGYAFAQCPDSIWKGQKWSVTFKFILDGVAYGLVTGATFGWLWPHSD